MTSLPLAEWVEAAGRMLVVREARVAVEVVRDVAPGEPFSSVLRGLFGERLRDLRCQTRAPSCDGCPVVASCDFGQLFVGGDAAESLRPRPFWLDRLPLGARVAAGTRFDARVRLVGPAAAALPYVDAALRSALERIGLRSGRGEGPALRLGASTSEVLAIGDPPKGAVAGRAWVVASGSPLDLRGDLDRSTAECPSAPWLALLARAGVRRLDGLWRGFGGAPDTPRVEWPSLAAVTVRALESDDWSAARWSRRQRRSMRLDGKTLRAEVLGPSVDALLPLLHALTVTGVGKHTTFGLGALELRPAGE